MLLRCHPTRFNALAPSVREFRGWPPTDAGWGPDRIARAWGELMQHLGYDRYGPGRRLGFADLKCDGPPGCARTAWRSHQLASDDAAGSRCRSRCLCARSTNSLGAGTRGVRCAKHMAANWRRSLQRYHDGATSGRELWPDRLSGQVALRLQVERLFPFILQLSVVLFEEVGVFNEAFRKRGQATAQSCPL